VLQQMSKSDSELDIKATIHDSTDIDINIMLSSCELCSKSCSIWSILQERYIFIGVWDCSTHRIIPFCGNDCRLLWLTLNTKQN
jgi:hypothetical protein